MFLTTVKQVKLEVRPLFLPQLVQLTSMLKPGLYSICVSWSSQRNSPTSFCFCCVVCNTFKYHVGAYVRIIKMNLIYVVDESQMDRLL